MMPSDHQKQALELASTTRDDATNTNPTLMPSFHFRNRDVSIMEHGYQSCGVRMNRDRQKKVIDERVVVLGASHAMGVDAINRKFSTTMPALV
jgi:hypothetical protein